MLSLHSLEFILEGKTLFKDISMNFLPSSIVYLKGKNGSGKTSLIRMLAGIQTPTQGKITFEKELLSILNLKKPYCTYIGHQLGLKLELTVLKNLKFWSKIYNSEKHIDEAIVYFNLQNIINKKCYELSAGNKKKTALARLISCQSRLWLLDEVDSNLDDAHKDLLLNLIVSHADNGGIVFITSHNQAKIKTTQILDIPTFAKVQS